MEGEGGSWLACPKIHVDLIFIYIYRLWLTVLVQTSEGGLALVLTGLIILKKKIYLFIYLFCSFCLACLDVFIGGGRVFSWFHFLTWHRDPNFSFI
jgi:uncharacterized membrane protein